ncbi:hypothetical protein Goshw_022667 [Gossypium schwendimanii]|uniref:Uncharacterized protein n=7 Tax=Gossypium TaxID=3633 RepID=A0A7J8Q2H2_GOSRA|nr:hypothetical protein [Gossypium lobatum]MBA0595430.1 hypothetical protein [Gossypium raimondii]MBA0635392.1 hypothetical protein [Gossypium davidsonii]MBA0659105.1 hypothetical protein [Gossypium klotzschianum]MBA0720602.1 hypothetical protein [Gossypium laxum]MBA0808067.1 hypothetical protein [Gossypium harknessii]MBA0866592.1 hypothetical protein [Gossypium schwendimanii]
MTRTPQTAGKRWLQLWARNQSRK